MFSGLNKITNYILFSLFLLLTFTTITLSAKWKFLSGGNNSEHYVDSTSVSTSSHIREVRFKTVYSNYKNKATGKYTSKRIMMIRFDCKKKRYGILQIDDYNKNGKNIFSEIYIVDFEWENLVSGTHIQRFYKYVCNKK